VCTDLAVPRDWTQPEPEAAATYSCTCKARPRCAAALAQGLVTAPLSRKSSSLHECDPRENEQEGFEGDGQTCAYKFNNCNDLKQAGTDADGVYEVRVGLGRIVALYHRLSTVSDSRTDSVPLFLKRHMRPDPRSASTAGC
jgi:hypothetical protein